MKTSACELQGQLLSEFSVSRHPCVLPYGFPTCHASPYHHTDQFQASLFLRRARTITASVLSTE